MNNWLKYKTLNGIECKINPIYIRSIKHAINYIELTIGTENSSYIHKTLKVEQIET